MNSSQAKLMKFVSNGDVGSLNDKPIESIVKLDGFIFEALDDTTMNIDGYVEIMRDFGNKNYGLDIATVMIVNGEKRAGPIKFYLPDMCKAYIQEDTWWNPFTKLWTNCPPSKGVLCILFEKKK